MQILGGPEETGKDVTKGCPEGSVLGLLFWNIIFDEAIEIAGKDRNQPIAFADDLIVVDSANTRREIEARANNVTRALYTWCKQQKLELSTTKSDVILLKGFLDIKRPPTVKINCTSLKMRPTVRYLGVKFGTRLNVKPHIDITTKARNLFSGFMKLARTHWETQYKYNKGHL